LKLADLTVNWVVGNETVTSWDLNLSFGRWLIRMRYEGKCKCTNPSGFERGGSKTTGSGIILRESIVRDLNFVPK
jgi:hypothetical protein